MKASMTAWAACLTLMCFTSCMIVLTFCEPIETLLCSAVNDSHKPLADNPLLPVETATHDLFAEPGAGADGQHDEQ